LKNWRFKHKGGPDDLVFASRTGRPMSDGNRDLSDLRSAARPSRELARVRHLHSSLLAYPGIPASVAQALLGTRTRESRIYTLMASGAQREAVEKLERFYCSQVAAEAASKMVN
jgi:hypothetical protein